MIDPLSRCTTYIETYAIAINNGEQKLRSYATGFFVRTADALLLVTNWHVVTGLDPENPSSTKLPTPSVMKLTVISKDDVVTELMCPLYDRHLKPLWKEHTERSAIDLVVYPLPIALEKYFVFVDVQEFTKANNLDATVGKDVFILGYPFAKAELKQSFGEDSAYYLPIWKRGSIATEPDVRLGGRVTLIDSLSRPGMSGAPVLIAEDHLVVFPGSAENARALSSLMQGTGSAWERIAEVDFKSLNYGTKKRFRFLGIYSGVLGSTRLQEVALGKCWHGDALREICANPQDGEMPYHSPQANEHYVAFLDGVAGKLILKDRNGELIEQVPLDRQWRDMTAEYVSRNAVSISSITYRISEKF